MYTIYQVNGGDTLENIANKYNTSAEILSSLNGITVDTFLTPGTFIVVPKTENPYFMEYTVKQGDNIYSIARKMNINPSNLLRLNGLNETDIIYPNQKIMLPKENVLFYVTQTDDTLDKIIKEFNTNADDLIKQNPTIYLTNDQLIVYKK